MKIQEIKSILNWLIEIFRALIKSDPEQVRKYVSIINMCIYIESKLVEEQE